MFNNSDYDTNTGIDIDTIKKELNNVYLKKTGTDTSTAITSFSEDITISKNLNLLNNSKLNVNNSQITPTELSYLDNVNSNIQSQIDNIVISGGGTLGILSSNNVWSGQNTFNQPININSNINTNSKTISTTELSYLDGASSNLQIQLDNKQPIISNPVNGNLISMDAFGKNINNNISVLTDTTLTNTNDTLIPSSKAIKTYVDNALSNLPANTIGQAINFYFTNISSGISNYEIIRPYPDNTGQDIEFVTVQNNEVLIGGYITNGLNRNKIDKGEFTFTLYASVDDNVSYSYIRIDIYTRTVGGVETLILNNIKSSDINNIYPLVNTVSAFGTLTSDIIINSTDELVIKIYAGTTVINKSINVYFYHGGNTNSFFSSPLSYDHNSLNNVQGGSSTEKYHLTLNQYNNATSISNSTQTGLLSNSDWNIFFNKQNNIVATNVNQYYRGDKTFQDLNKAAIGLSNVDNTADLLKPISNPTQTALNLKQNLIDNTTDLVVKSISDVSGNLRAAINNIPTTYFNNWYQCLFVAGQFGNDTNNGLTFNSPYKTIQYALNNVNSNSGVNIIIAPWTYTETNLTCNKQNITISSIIGNEIGGLISIDSLTISSTSSSVRLIGLSISTLTISGNCSVYISCCKISTLNINGTGYKEIRESNITSAINIYTSCIINLINGNNLPCVIQNVSGLTTMQLNISNNLVCGSMLFYSGTIGISNTPVYSAGTSYNSITASNCYLYLTNTSLLNPDNSYSKISLTNVYYSIVNTVYNKTSSTITTSTKLNNRTSFYEIINSDNLYLNNLYLSDNTLLTSTVLKYLVNISSDVQTQINNISSSQISLSSANIWTNTNTFTNNLTISNTGNLNLNGNINANSLVISPFEISCLKNVNLNIQNSLNSKLDTNNFLTNNNNIRSGQNPIFSPDSNYNIALGSFSLNSINGNSTKQSNQNIGIGSNSLNLMVIGNNNIAVGNSSLPVLGNLNNTTDYSYNIGVGALSGSNLYYGNYNTFIGYASKIDSSVSGNLISNSTAIGSNSTITASYQIVLGTNNHTVIIPNSITVNGNVELSSTVLSYLSGLTSNVQTQLNSINISLSGNNIWSGINKYSNDIWLNSNLVLNNGNITITQQQLQYLNGLTGNIQNQINSGIAPQWVSISSSASNTVSLSHSTATTYQKIYSVSTGNVLNITMPNVYYLDYSYLVNGKTLKINYNFFCKDSTGRNAGYQAYLFPLPSGYVIDDTKCCMWNWSNLNNNWNYGGTSAENWNCHNMSSAFGEAWVQCSNDKRNYGKVIGWYYPNHMWHKKAVMISLDNGIYKVYLADNAYGLNDNLWINYKWSAEIPIL